MNHTLWDSVKSRMIGKDLEFYTGNVEYMLGYSKTKSIDDLDSFPLVVQAEKEWPEISVPQVIAHAG